MQSDGMLHAIAATAFVVLVGFAVQRDGPPPVPGTTALARAAGVLAQDTSRFQHTRHEAVSCLTCHSTGTGRGVRTLALARDCQGCHHADSALGLDCARCHTREEIGPQRRLPTPISLTVWTAPRSRELPFEHGRHETIPCTACHGVAKERAVQRDCASCHVEHHQAGATCATCHAPAASSHPRQLHLTGCGTSGCHEREATPAVTPTRSTCLACHAPQRDHMSGRECAGCHLSDWASSGGGRQ